MIVTNNNFELLKKRQYLRIGVGIGFGDKFTVNRSMISNTIKTNITTFYLTFPYKKS